MSREELVAQYTHKIQEIYRQRTPKSAQVIKYAEFQSGLGLGLVSVDPNASC